MQIRKAVYLSLQPHKRIYTVVAVTLVALAVAVVGDDIAIVVVYSDLLTEPKNVRVLSDSTVKCVIHIKQTSIFRMRCRVSFRWTELVKTKDTV